MVGNMGKGAIILLVVVVVAVGAFVISGSDIPLRTGTTVVQDITDTGAIIAVTGGQNYNGDLITTFEARDSNDPAIAYAGDTTFDIICYERIGDDVRDWEFLAGGNDADPEVATIPVRQTTARDDGILAVWCEITPESGSSVIFDKDGTISANSRIDTCIYDDPTLDQTNDWICRIGLLNVSPTDPNNIPTLNIRLRFIEDATSADLTATASIIDIGTGNVENRIRWDVEYVTTASLNDSGAKGLSRVSVSINATDGDDSLYDIGQSRVEIPNNGAVQRVLLSQMDVSELTSKIIYRFNYDQATDQRDIASANIVNVQKGADPMVKYPVIITTRFSNIADALCVELELTYVDSFNVFSSTSDDAELVADSSNANECTL